MRGKSESHDLAETIAAERKSSLLHELPSQLHWAVTLIAARGRWIKSPRLQIPMGGDSDVPEVSGGDLKSQVVHALGEYVREELGLQEPWQEPKYCTVNSYLESKYNTRDARDKFAADLQNLLGDVVVGLCDQLGEPRARDLSSKVRCFSEVPDVDVVPGRGRQVLVHRLGLWSLSFEGSCFLSGGEPTVHILRVLKRHLIQSELPREAVVSYHLAGLVRGQKLPSFSVHTVCGAEEVLHGFLVGHCLLHLHEWPGLPCTADLAAVIQALLPRRLLEVFCPRVVVQAREEILFPHQWTSLYLDYIGRHRPNPLQVLRALQRRAIHFSDDVDELLCAIRSVNNHVMKDKRISDDMKDCLKLIARAGPAFRGKLEAG